MCKTEAELPVQAISPFKTVKSADGVEYSLGALSPFSVRASGFKATVDDEEIDVASQLWSGTDNGASILLVKDGKNEVSYIHIQDELSETMIVSLDEPGTKMSRSEMMVTITPDDFDYEAMNKIFHYDHATNAEGQDGARALATAGFDDASTGRELQAACSSLQVIEIAIVYDSSFCARYGGSASAAQSRVEAIVALASQRYEVPGLCKTLQLSRVDGYCNPSTDAYRNVIDNENLLNIFQAHWNANRQDRRRDTAHLFSGTDYSVGTGIGRAYVGAVCNLESAYGINWMTFSMDLSQQANLFAHELGHNAGANHYLSSNTGHVMNPSINNQRNGFSSASIASMNSYLGRQNCLSSTTTTPPPSGGDFFEFRSALSTSSKLWCLDLARADTTNGSPIVLWSCNGSPHQQWTLDSEGYMRSKVNTNKCVVTSGANLNAGTMFMIWDCTPNFPDMQWLRYTDSSIRPRNARSQCMDVRGDAVASDGATIQLYNCGNRRGDQVWTEV
jgi:hypothetical protein